ncbi:hypothetical protein [Enterobacter hormaechei]|uniref:hypothetical protein n=1 Tax=Enterobacter hormaechei TaxID=158836 RepID=UPI003999EA8F
MAGQLQEKTSSYIFPFLLEQRLNDALTKISGLEQELAKAGKGGKKEREKLMARKAKYSEEWRHRAAALQTKIEEAMTLATSSIGDYRWLHRLHSWVTEVAQGKAPDCGQILDCSILPREEKRISTFLDTVAHHSPDVCRNYMKQLPDTPEQSPITQYKGPRLVVKAYAGTGKTTTLVSLRPQQLDHVSSTWHTTGLSATRQEKKFPANVDCKTSHQLAYATIGRGYQHKLSGNLRLTDIAQAVNTKNWTFAKDILDTLNAFMCSADMRIYTQFCSRRHG